MSRVPSEIAVISLKLSEVLGDIGVTEGMVLKRRRIFTLMETLDTTTHRLLGKNVVTYNFGSQSEGSTTKGLDSDIDSLFCLLNLNVIQDWSDWKHRVLNVLMVQDETTSPGYCLLQPLHSDVFSTVKSNMHHGIDGKGRLLMKNSYFDTFILEDQSRNGPAHAFDEVPGFCAEDNVLALYSESWPIEAKPWLARKCIGGWPTEEVKRNCATKGCFLVSASSKTGLNEEFEWRISTSLAERCLMFSLNITQIRCYILMKMINKTFINPQCDGILSSFMCKTVLFYCIEKTASSEWQEHNLLACLKCCLETLQNCVKQENCPHFITPGNNLMAGKLSPPIKGRLQEILQNIILSEGRILLEVPIDDLGARLEAKMSPAPVQPVHQRYSTRDLIHGDVSAALLKHIAIQLSIRHKVHLEAVACKGNEIVHSRSLIYELDKTIAGKGLNTLEKSAYELFKPFLCSSIASAIASHDIRADKTISQQAEAWFSEGLNSDVSSGRLKFASALYCSGDFERAELVLRTTEDRYDWGTVETVCTCRDRRTITVRLKFCNRSNTGNEELVKDITAFYVRFIPCEINCVPQELQYEIFRSTQEDRLHRHKHNDNWMDWAVVDSLPYLYFLQYKTYGHLQRPEDQQIALAKLRLCIFIDHNLGHIETALNLLGQCFELEKMYNSALDCYTRSLNKCGRNNVAKVHICRLLNVLVNRQAV